MAAYISHFTVALVWQITDGEIPSKYVEAAAFAYLAYLKKGELYLSK